jgi:phospholipid/cholesterol/gamma-HCH transport system substrate-binding protein
MSATSSRYAVARVASPIALLIAVCALAYIVLVGSSSYTIHAHFLDASQLVRGGSVEVAGRKVGSVSHIGVTPDGQADVALSIDDTSIAPLHVGTRAAIRALSQAGVANHYVELTPGSARAPTLHNGGFLPTEQTTSMVNLDAILDSFGPSERASLQRLIANSAQVYAGSGSRYFNQMLARLDPALAQLNGLTGELADDRAAISQLIHTGATAAGAIASRSTDLRAAVANTAVTMQAIASERQALADSFVRAPAVLDQARVTLADAATALTALRPALRDVPPAAGPLAGFLHRIDSTLPAATPVVAQLRAELPALRASLAGLGPLAPPAVRALHSAAKALKTARPIVRAARFYGSDLLLGVFQGLAGVATANYDRWGHYARLEFTQPYQTALGGPLSSLLSAPLAPSLFDLHTRVLRRCPGGNTPPAPDGSSPWVPDPSICTPSQDVAAGVNFP